MKYFLRLVLMLMLAAGCQERELTYEQVEKKLMETMQEYLNEQREGKAQFTVKEVIFFPEKSRYLCEFRVNMKSGNLDTIGVMKANISKNFKDVERMQ